MPRCLTFTTIKKSDFATLYLDDDIEDDDDEEPLMSGSGKVVRECSEEQLDNWSVIITKWKDVNSRPKQVKTLIRKQVYKI